jgi:hypothetical protein
VTAGFAAPYDRALNFQRHVSELIRDWQAEPVLERYVRQRMDNLGVPPGCVGIVDETETGSAFSLEHDLGGRNTKPGRAAGVTRGGINVDYGVFNPDLLPFDSWRSVSLRDRIDAVIVHELYEYRSRSPTTALRHRQAILNAPATKQRILSGARRILADYRAWFRTYRRERRMS